MDNRGGSVWNCSINRPSQRRGLILRENLAMRYRVKLQVLSTAVGMLTGRIGVAGRLWRRDSAFVDLPAGVAVRRVKN